MPAPGREILSMRGHKCFLPDPLPPVDLSLSRESSRLHDEALHKLGQLEGANRLLPDTDLLTFALLALESIASSRIEGTVASPDELVLFQLEPSGWDDRVREVANYRRAIKLGLQALDDREISLSLVLELHRTLMHGVRGEEHGGKLKTDQNFIAGRPGDTIEDAIYVPPPPEFTRELMEDLVAYVRSTAEERALVRIAVSHYQFEAVHPFGDGNGRIGRVLILLSLVKDGLLSRPMVHPSVYLEENRDEYLRRLRGVQADGEWDAWIRFFLEAVVSQCEASLSLISRITRVREDVTARISGVRRAASAAKVIEAFFIEPVQTVARVSRSSGLSINTVRSAVEDMEASGVLREITGKKSRRAYVCEPIWRAIFK